LLYISLIIRLASKRQAPQIPAGLHPIFVHSLFMRYAIRTASSATRWVLSPESNVIANRSMYKKGLVGGSLICNKRHKFMKVETSVKTLIYKKKYIITLYHGSRQDKRKYLQWIWKINKAFDILFQFYILHRSKQQNTVCSSSICEHLYGYQREISLCSFRLNSWNLSVACQSINLVNCER
jgi:hypothetical protein